MVTNTQYLFVEKAPVSEQKELYVGLHPSDLPTGVHPGDYIRIQVAKSGRSVTCQVRHHSRLYHVRLNRSLREALRVQAALPYDFRIQRAPSWAFFWYTMRYHPEPTTRAKVLGVVATVALAAVGALVPIVLSLL